jgi:hypothetical protein
VTRNAWRKRNLRQEKEGQRFTPAQQFGAFVLLCAILCGAAGGGIGKLVTEDRLSQFVGWLIGVSCGIGVGRLLGTFLKRRGESRKAGKSDGESGQP